MTTKRELGETRTQRLERFALRGAAAERELHETKQALAAMTQRAEQAEREANTINDIRALRPCYDPSRYLPEDWQGTALDVLNIEACPAEDRLWVVLREGWIDERTLRLFAVWCARQALALVKNPDPRSVTACGVAERYANGEATAAELAAASDAASDAALAARAAASDAALAARAAASDAAWAARAASDAALAAALAAASDAAWAARAARAAASDAALAARAAAWAAALAATQAAGWDAQVDHLRAMLQEAQP